MSRRWCSDCDTYRERTEPRWALIWAAYIAIALLTFGFSWHRDCKNPMQDYNGPPRPVCSAVVGAIWPLYLSLRAIVWATNPDTFSLPKLEWK